MSEKVYVLIYRDPWDAHSLSIFGVYKTEQAAQNRIDSDPILPERGFRIYEKDLL